MKLKSEPLEKCTNSIVIHSTDDGGDYVATAMPCTLDIHPEEDKKGRPVHVTKDGIRWS